MGRAIQRLAGIGLAEEHHAFRQPSSVNLDDCKRDGPHRQVRHSGLTTEPVWRPRLPSRVCMLPRLAGEQWAFHSLVHLSGEQYLRRAMRRRSNILVLTLWSLNVTKRGMIRELRLRPLTPRCPICILMLTAATSARDTRAERVGQLSCRSHRALRSESFPCPSSPLVTFRRVVRSHAPRLRYRRWLAAPGWGICFNWLTLLRAS